MDGALNKTEKHSTPGKPALRRAMAARRAGLGEAAHAAASAAIVGHLCAALAPPGIVAFCWPIRREPDVRAIIEIWRQRGSRAALPVVTGAAEPLAFREWDANTPMQADRYGIPTPATGDWLLPDLILLPLNGFDAAGYRLGYGGGYFDRTLAALKPRPMAVGVGFEINRLPDIRPEAHDQQLDWIVTEAGACKPGA
jgi:5,10-methenyltetrahydrofolate synthetase